MATALLFASARRLSTSSFAAARRRLSTTSSFTTSSSIVTRELTGCHDVTIDGCAASKKALRGWFWSSQTFEVGGYSWQVRYTPHGGDSGYTALHLQLLHGASGSPSHVHPIEYKFSLLDQSGNPVPKFTRATTKACSFNESRSSGFDDFIRWKDLEASGCLRDDRFAVRCDVTVTRNLNHWKNDDGSSATVAPAAAAAAVRVVMPPSDLHERLNDLLWKSKRGADVTIAAGGGEATFDGHGWLLAARSPVLEAHLMMLASKEEEGEADRRRIEIHSVEPRVFEAMLHYIYTDALPEKMMRDQKEADADDVAATMAGRLLAAAHRFKIERLRLMCEVMLCKRIDVSTAAETLAVAERHGCRGLRAACLEFMARPGTLEAVMATEGFDKLRANPQSIMMFFLFSHAHALNTETFCYKG